MIKEVDNNMKKQVYGIKDIFREQFIKIEERSRKVLSTPEIYSIQKIVLTGCGDSYAASMFTKKAFEKLTKFPIEVVSAIDLARNYEESQLGFAPNNPLVIAVSNSGTGARVGEAVERVRKHGGFVLGITGNENSVLGKNSSKILNLNIPKLPSAPGVTSYLISVLSLLLMAIRIGEVRGRYTMDHANELRGELLDQAERFIKNLADIDNQVFEISKQFQDNEAWDFIGNSSDYATAWYSMAKVMEATGQYSMHINSEEFNHLNFFMRNTHKINTVFYLSKNDKGYSRTVESIEYSHKLERPTLIISDDEEICKKYPLTILIDSSKVDELPYLFQFVPIALLTGYVMVHLCEEAGRGVKGLWSFASGGKGVKESEIVIL